MIITEEERQKRMEEFVSKMQKNEREEESIIIESLQNDKYPSLIEELNNKLDLEIEIPEKKKTLVEILGELDRLDSYCDDKDHFDSVMNELRIKVESIVNVLRRMDNRIEELDSDIDELTKKKKTYEMRRKNLENYLKTSLSNAQFTQLSTRTFDVKIKPSTALVVDQLADSLDLTREDIKPYVVSKTTYQFDKMKIKEDIKSETFPKELQPYFYISSDKNLNYKFRR